MLDEFEKTFTRQLTMLALPDQSSHRTHIDVLEDIPRFGYQLVHLLYQLLPKVKQVSLCSLGQQEQGATIDSHKFIERIQLD